MSVTVGVREFREELAGFIDRAEPVTVTRHGEAVGLFIPVKRDRRAILDAAVEASKKAHAMLEAAGISEDEVVAEFDALRKASYAQEMAA